MELASFLLTSIRYGVNNREILRLETFDDKKITVRKMNLVNLSKADM